MDEQSAGAGRGIEVTGRAVVTGPPDVVRIRMAVTAARPSVAEALAVADTAVRQVRAALANRGAAGRDAATAGLTIGVEQAWEQGVTRFLGYRCTHDLAVTSRDLDGLGLLLGEALAAGGDEALLNGVQFEVEDDRPLRSRAREAAWLDALARATRLAGLAGRELGPVLDLVESAAGSGGVVLGYQPAAAKLDAVELSVDPGSVGVEVSLSVRWALG